MEPKIGDYAEQDAKLTAKVFAETPTSYMAGDPHPDLTRSFHRFQQLRTLEAAHARACRRERMHKAQLAILQQLVAEIGGEHGKQRAESLLRTCKALHFPKRSK